MAKQKPVKEVKPAEAPKEGIKEEVKPPVEVGGLKRIKVTPQELAKLQVEKKLVGYDPATQEAIVK